MLRKPLQTVSLCIMMQLIADSGSTKTDWKLISDKEGVTAFHTAGLNPYHLSDERIQQILKEHVLPIVKKAPDEIHFYGAGCAAEENKLRVKSCFKEIFPETKVQVETDLVGAARALLHNEEGEIAILGTGSNAGFYDGKNMVKSFDSLGWILGDEGSGTHIGRLILRDWLRGKFVPKLGKAMIEFCPLSRDEILHRIYHDQNSAAFIASFAKFAHQEIASDQIKEILREAFQHFISEIAAVFNLPSKTQIHFCGSIAWHFQNQLAEEVINHDLLMGTVLQSPSEELVKYHA